MVVRFNHPVDHGTIVAGGFGEDPSTFSLLVQASWSNFADGYVPGEVVPVDQLTTRFNIHDEFQTFREGDYRITLFGDIDPAGRRPTIADTQGLRLDGEFIVPLNQAPSGDGAEGGDFAFKAEIH
jgi:hypothetical protein